jgi:RND family efflux transporter MFP subunit
MQKARLAAISAVLLAIIASIAFYVSIKGPLKSDTVTVSRKQLVRAVYATGTVEPVQWAKLAPHKTARLLEYAFDEGQAVTKSSIIAQMENHVEKERLAEAQARLEFNNKELERYLALSKQSAVSRKQLEDAQRAQKESLAQVQAIQQELKDLTLVSPLDGIVLRRDVEQGETVQAGQVIFWVGKAKPLRITAEVDEEDIAQVAVGQKALIKSDAFPEQIFEGTVSEITPKGDSVNKVFRVRIALPDSAPLLTGMTTEVNIIVKTVDNALVVPKDSETSGKVWRVVGSKAKETNVKTGIRSDTHIEILDGLQEGEIVLQQAPVHIRD